MKVEQEGTRFAPITITLETKEEADIMWALLNAPIPDIVKNSKNYLIAGDIEELAYQMFCAFDDIYPKEVG